MIKGIKIHKSINEINILNGIDISINEGEIVSVVGKSGAGKTTLLQILGTLEKPTSGKVLFNNKDVFMLNENTIGVQDNGRGMTQEEFEHLSKPYTRKPNQNEQGTGLGLNICLAILKEHGFSVSCEKNEAGTLMKIKLT